MVSHNLHFFSLEPNLYFRNLEKPLFIVKFKADLENVSRVYFAEDTTHYFNLKCTNCGQEAPKTVEINPKVEFERPQKSKGTCHLVMKCKECKNDGTVERFTRKWRKQLRI